MENDRIVPTAELRVPEADELIAPGTPIQFDIVLPATEFLEQNRGNRYTPRGVRGGLPEKREETRGLLEVFGASNHLPRLLLF